MHLNGKRAVAGVHGVRHHETAAISLYGEVGTVCAL
jgi:hypothetical protein